MCVCVYLFVCRYLENVEQAAEELRELEQQREELQKKQQEEKEEQEKEERLRKAREQAQVRIMCVCLYVHGCDCS